MRPDSSAAQGITYRPPAPTKVRNRGRVTRASCLLAGSRVLAPSRGGRVRPWPGECCQLWRPGPALGLGGKGLEGESVTYLASLGEEGRSPARTPTRRPACDSRPSRCPHTAVLHTPSPNTGDAWLLAPSLASPPLPLPLREAPPPPRPTSTGLVHHLRVLRQYTSLPCATRVLRRPRTCCQGPLRPRDLLPTAIWLPLTANTLRTISPC